MEQEQPWLYQPDSEKTRKYAEEQAELLKKVTGARRDELIEILKKVDLATAVEDKEELLREAREFVAQYSED